jgi:hypothetical protein
MPRAIAYRISRIGATTGPPGQWEKRVLNVSRTARFAKSVVIWLLMPMAGCAATPVTLTPEGERVLVLEPPFNLRECQYLGRIQASATNLRGDVEAQRLVNARNRAAALGGNRIVVGLVQLLGAREFEVYQCPPGMPAR